MIPSIEVKETGYRWVILFLYSFCVGCNAMLWITAAPITSVISKTYGVADIWVEMCSLVYMILYLPIVFPSNYILDTFGLRVGVISYLDLNWSFLHCSWRLDQSRRRQ